MKHIKILNKEDGQKLPLTAEDCSWFNLCVGGDWDECGGKMDFCVKDGAEPAT